MDDFEPPITFDRVTQVLSPFTGYAMIDPGVLKLACERGNDVHECIEAIQDGIPVIINESLQPYIDSYNVWAKDKKFIESPPRLFNESMRITGKLDCIYDSPEGLVLVDFKTSVSEGKTWKYQGSAYSYMCKEKGYDIRKIEFVRLSKEGKPARSHFYQEDMEHFKILLAVYREFFKGGKIDVGDL